MRRTNLTLLQILALLAAGSQVQAAVTLYDNTNQGPANGLVVQLEYRTFAQPFVAGEQGFDNISSITLSLQRIGSQRGASVQVEIWGADDTGLPDRRIGTVGSIGVRSLSTSPQLVTVEGTVRGLTPSLTYFVVITVSGSGLNATRTVGIGVLSDGQGTESAGQILAQGTGETPWISLAESDALLPDSVDSATYLQMAVLAVADGRREYTSVTSPGLVVNKVGDPSTRRAVVYLPPGYDASDKRYPAVYLLSGTGNNEDSFTGTGIHALADQLINEGTINEMILVSVDGSTTYSSGFYTNSELHGYHEDYLVRHLVQHIDSTYRTLPTRNSRGIMGHSTGGYGALLYGMKYSHVFGAAYSASGGGLCWSLPGCVIDLSGDRVEWSLELQSLFGGTASIANSLASVGQISGISNAVQNEHYSMAAAFSPNLDNPPLYVDLPFDLPSREIRPDIRDKWYKHDLFHLLPDHMEELSSLKGIAMDIGNRDEIGLYAENEAFHQLLLEADIPHRYQVFSGGHGGSWHLRWPWMLTFFTEVLDTLSPNGLGDYSDPNEDKAYPGPLADAGEDRVINISPDQETVTVHLDAGASQAGSAELLSYDWSDDEQHLGEGVTLELALPAGRHVCYLVVTDAEGRQAVTDVIVYVN